MKKITKFLPLAMALLLVSPAMATPSETATSEMTIEVPQFVNVQKVSEVATTNATFSDDYTTITLAPALNAKFQVINNLPERAVYLQATAPVSDTGNAKALYGTAGAMKLVFTNSTRLPAATAVENITSGSAAFASNPNAIAFAITTESNFAPDGDSGATDATMTFSDNVAKYVISNGVYNPTYTIATGAEAQTFSTHDTNGTYQATLTLTTTAP